MTVLAGIPSHLIDRAAEATGNSEDLQDRAARIAPSS
jgi:hypothetical protein